MQQRVLFPAAALLAATLTATLAVAQIKPGHSIHTVTVGGATAGTGEMYDVDHQAQKATKLTIPTVLVSDRPNTVLMTSAVGGYIGTNPISPAGPTGNIYAFTVLNNTVNLLNSGKPLNTTATAGNNVAQIAVLNNRIYFCTQNTANTGGVLQSIPQAGGAVQIDLDIGTVQVTNLSNAVAILGNVVYVAAWDVSTTTLNGGELVAYDTITKRGTLVMQLPRGKYKPNATTTYGCGIVCMHPDPNNSAQLALAGVYGDLLIINPDQKNGHKNPTVVSHLFTGGTNTAGNAVINYANSFHYDPTTKDWVVGTRDGHIDRWVDGHSAEKIIAGVGSSATASSNSINGSHYFPVTKNHDHTIGAGCPGNGYTPTDVALGAAVSPNPNFKFALFTGNGGARYLLALGLQNKVSGGQVLPWLLPGTSSCFLRMDPLMILSAGTLGGTGAALGTAVVAVPIPSGVPVGVTLYRQWAMDLGMTPASFVLSNAREIKFQ
ncbi:MAG: hypothetical protein ACYTGO_09915 [Planctomycetota bacterium]|jgi:hypothetical protein